MKLAKLLRILAVSVILAGYSAWVSSRRESVLPSAQSSVAEIPLLRVEEAESLWRSGSTVFLDVRSSIDYAYGHITGAISFPEEEIEERLLKMKPRLERVPAIVVYCGSRNCGKSLWAAIRLRNAGLSQTKIFPAGFNEWHQHELPITRDASR